MANDNKTYVTITLRRTTQERMKRDGKMGESYDTFINRILDTIEGKSETNEKKQKR